MIDGLYVDYTPPFGVSIPGYYCSCGARKDKLYTSSSILIAHHKTKAHQKWIEVLNLNKANHFIENIKLHETVVAQRVIIAKLEKTVASKDTTIHYLTRQLTAQSSAFVSNLLD